MNTTYDHIGKGYNLTRQADPYIVQKLHDFLNPIPKNTYLDIGCGTGNYTLAMAQKGLNFIGIDPSISMLNKAQLVNSPVRWKKGSAENIPLDNDSVDGCIASLTVHHWTNLQQGFRDIHRVLKPQGRLVIFTSTPQQMSGYWLHHYFPKMMVDSMEQMPSLEVIVEHMTAAGYKNFQFEPYSVQTDLKDLFLYSGKHNPQLYLNAQVRHGISSFSHLAHQSEVEKGLKTLKKDLKTKHIQNIIKNYDNASGDYLFIVSDT